MKKYFIQTSKQFLLLGLMSLFEWFRGPGVLLCPQDVNPMVYIWRVSKHGIQNAT